MRRKLSILLQRRRNEKSLRTTAVKQCNKIASLRKNQNKTIDLTIFFVILEITFVTDVDLPKFPNLVSDGLFFF